MEAVANLPVKVKAEAAVVLVVQAEVDQVETDQALEPEVIEVKLPALLKGVHQLAQEQLSRELIKEV